MSFMEVSNLAAVGGSKAAVKIYFLPLLYNLIISDLCELAAVAAVKYEKFFTYEYNTISPILLLDVKKTKNFGYIR